MSQSYDNCFACGTANPIGLKLNFSYDEGQALAQLQIPKLYEGYPEVIHGGIIATLLDEAMAKAVLHSGTTAFTAKLTTSYRHPLPALLPITIKGWITEAKTRTIRTAALITAAQGTIYASAEAVFVVPKR